MLLKVECWLFGLAKKNKNAADQIKKDSKGLTDLNEEIGKLQELQNKLEKIPENVMIDKNIKEDLMLKNEELKAYEDYFNKYLDVDLKLEEEKQNEQENKLKFLELTFQLSTNTVI